MKLRLFITSSGTGIGKTHVTCALVEQALAARKSVEAYKPVASGFDPAAVAPSDTGKILKSLGLAPIACNIERMSPWRFAAPLAPSMAARVENRPLEYPRLIEFTREVARSSADIVLIEGVGGVMAPLTDGKTVLNWIEDSGFDALLVVGSYLGAISHALTALEVLKGRRVPLRGIVVNQPGTPDVSVEDTCAEIGRRAGGIPVTAGLMQFF